MNNWLNNNNKKLIKFNFGRSSNQQTKGIASTYAHARTDSFTGM